VMATGEAAAGRCASLLLGVVDRLTPAG